MTMPNLFLYIMTLPNLFLYIMTLPNLFLYIMTQPNLQYAAHNKIQYSSNNHITSDKEMQKIEENLAVL